MNFIKHKNTVDPEFFAAAIELRYLLEKYSEIEREAEVVRNALEPMLNQIISGTAKLPIEQVPYSYTFHEGKLRKYSDLEDAYSNFAIRAKGYDLNRMDKFFDSLENDPKFAAKMNSTELTYWETLKSVWSRRLCRLKGRLFKR